MFPTAKRTFLLLLRTPIVPPPPAPPTFELTPLTHTPRAGPSRPRAASRTISSLSSSGYAGGGGYGMRGYASDHGKKELYSDEAGSTGAGTDDVAHTDAAFNSEANPDKATKGVQEETGKNFTTRSPNNPTQSQPSKSGQGEDSSDSPMRSSRKEAGKD